MTEDPAKNSPEEDAEKPAFDPYINVKIPKKAFFLFVILTIVIVSVDSIHRIKTHFKLKRRAARNKKRYSMEAVTRNGVKLAEKKGDIVVVHDPLLIYKNKGSQKSDYFTINKQGFRGPDWTVKKDSQTKRVIILGSSVVFGHSLDKDEEVFPRVLQDELRAKFPGQGIEVYNAGVIGYLSCQDFTLLTSQILQYKPDLIVLFNGWNDFFAGGRNMGQVSQMWFFNELEKSLRKAKTPSWNPLKLSSLYQSFERKLAKAKASKPVPFEKNPKALEGYLHYLKLSIQIARANSIKVLVAPQPELTMRTQSNPKLEAEIKPETYWPGYSKRAQEDYSQYISGAQKLAKQLRAPFFDSRDFITKHPDEVFFKDPVHMSSAGHKRCAEALKEPVAKLLGLQ